MDTAEFNASAITYVGNYTGPCLIQLNGEAILIKLHTGVMINKWPYNCIRQFRAEDETGKFSFVSGRRGPYGVAEYNFSLPDDSLRTLQDALTNFTGAQFSSVAPGSGAEQQQQPLPQQPLPPYPPSHPRHTYSMSENYQMANSKHVVGGNRSDSITSSSSGDFRNTIITSQLHSQQLPLPSSDGTAPTINHFKVPKLPPRDYTLTNLPASPSVVSEEGSQFSISMDEETLRLLHKERSLTVSSLSSRSRSSTSASDGGSIAFNAPSLPPKRAHEPSETWVAQGPSYEDVNALNQHSTKGINLSRSRTVTSGGSSFGTPQKKKLFDRLRGLPEPETTTGSENKENATGPDNVKKDPTLESSLDVINMSRSPAEQDKLQTSAQKKDENYDHLPGEKEIAEYSTPNPEAEPVASPCGSISPDIIPMMSGWKKSPSYDEEAIDLPRSSPTVKVRSITPEQAQKIRRRAELGVVLHGRSLTTSRVSSEGSIDTHSKFTKKSQTMKNRSKGKAYASGHDLSDTYQVPRPLMSPDIAVEGKEEVDPLYNVPRPSSEADLYKVPKCVLDSPPNGRRVMRTSHNELDDVYSVPRPVEASEEVRSGDSKEEEGLYKIPSSILATSATRESGDLPYPQDTTKIPVEAMRDLEIDSIYNVPRGSTGAVTGSRDVIYNTPQPTSGHRAPSPPNSAFTTADRHEFAERQLPPTPGRLRSTRSFESLSKIRVKSSLPSGFSTVEDRRSGISSPISRGMYVDIDPKFHGMYEDIDLERGRTPAKNAPLPPLPSLGVPPSAAKFMDEGMYCEISEAGIAINRLNKKPVLSKQNTTEELSTTDKYTAIHKLPRSMTVSQYNEVKQLARPKYPDPSVSAMHGMTKAKKLSEEEGYEFCTPAPRPLRQEHLVSGRTRSMWVPQLVGLESSGISEIRSRPFSECNQQKVGAADPALLGTSTPADSGHLGDEYVIVTGTDRQLKLGSDSPISTEADVTGTVTEDMYEVMTSARAEHIQQRIQFQSCYSTPDPKLYSDYAPNDTRSSSSSSSSSSTQFGPVGQRVSDEYTHSLPPRGPDTEESEFAGINIESMSPSDSDAKPLYFNVFRLRQSSSTSMSSRNSDYNEEGGVSEGKNGHGERVEEAMAIQIPGRAAMVKTLEGSPLDIHESAQLKMKLESARKSIQNEKYESLETETKPNSTERNLARSLANVLEEGSPSKSALLHSTSSHTSVSPSSTSPPAQTTSINKRHHYINCLPKEDEEVPNSSTQERPTLKNKRPQPLPRSSLRIESVSSEPNLSS